MTSVLVQVIALYINVRLQLPVYLNCCMCQLLTWMQVQVSKYIMSVCLSV